MYGRGEADLDLVGERPPGLRALAGDIDLELDLDLDADLDLDLDLDRDLVGDLDLDLLKGFKASFNENIVVVGS